MNREERLRLLVPLMAGLLNNRTEYAKLLEKFEQSEELGLGLSFGMVLAMEADGLLCAAAKLCEGRNTPL